MGTAIPPQPLRAPKFPSWWRITLATARETSWRIFSRCWFVDLPDLTVSMDKVFPPSSCGRFSRDDTWYSVAIYMGSGNISRKRCFGLVLEIRNSAAKIVDTVGLSYRTIRLRAVFIEARRRELRYKVYGFNEDNDNSPIKACKSRRELADYGARKMWSRATLLSLSLFLLILFFTGQ